MQQNQTVLAMVAEVLERQARSLVAQTGQTCSRRHDGVAVSQTPKGRGERND